MNLWCFIFAFSSLFLFHFGKLFPPPGSAWAMQINFLLSLAIEHKLPAMKTSLFGCDVCERFFNRSNDDGNETKQLRKKNFSIIIFEPSQLGKRLAQRFFFHSVCFASIEKLKFISLATTCCRRAFFVLTTPQFLLESKAEAA